MNFILQITIKLTLYSSEETLFQKEKKMLRVERKRILNKNTALQLYSDVLSLVSRV